MFIKLQSIILLLLLLSTKSYTIKKTILFSKGATSENRLLIVCHMLLVEDFDCFISGGLLIGAQRFVLLLVELLRDSVNYKCWTIFLEIAISTKPSAAVSHASGHLPIGENWKCYGEADTKHGLQWSLNLSSPFLIQSI